MLDVANAADADTDVRIETLGRDLNVALARAAQEATARANLEAAERARLERYQSEFFGRLRDLIGDREGVSVVGDRFVFSSEVLFPSGSANLSEAGRAQIARVAGLLQDISADIPPNIDWVIRVDGHTDNVPIFANPDFADNWELSQARALSVVRYMSNVLGFPPERLAPTGFGEYQPIASDATPEGRAQNRRIELKLTER
jgi:chemotaxis protein MotB